VHHPLLFIINYTAQQYCTDILTHPLLEVDRVQVDAVRHAVSHAVRYAVLVTSLPDAELLP